MSDPPLPPELPEVPRRPPPDPPRRTIHLSRDPAKKAADIKFTGGATSADHPLGEDEATTLEQAVHALGAIFHNTIHQSWLSISDVNETLDRTFEILQKTLAEHNELTFSVVEGHLKVNRQPYPLKMTSEKTFVEHLARMQADHFTLYQGMSRLEFTTFIGLLTLLPEELAEKGGFYAAVNAEELPHVKAVKVIVQEVTEEEQVISKRELERKLEEERVQAEVNVMAMLRGEEGGDELAQAASAHLVASNSKGMAGLIIQAADEDTAQVEGGQPKSAGIVKCLRRAFNGLMKDPSLKTQKGKKALLKTLSELEREIHVQMGEAPDEADKAAVSEAIETMADEIRMDSIAAEYTKRLKAIEQSEKRILRFIKAQGLDEVEDSNLALKLSEAGLDVSGWHALLAKSHASVLDREESETEEGRLAAVGTLATLLTQLEGDATTAEAHLAEEAEQHLTEHLQQVDQEVKAITTDTERKILDLVTEIQMDLREDAADGGKMPQQKLDRRRLLLALAEIVQELCQPLSVISCSLNMVTSKTLGDVPQAQIDMLKLAHDSTQRIHSLVNALQEISGMPPDLSPDSRLQDAIYKKE